MSKSIMDPALNKPGKISPERLFKLRVEGAVKCLKKGCHVLSKDYGDGHGRKYWLRDKDQDDITELSTAEFNAVSNKVELHKERIISSDAAYWYEIA